MNAHKKSHVYAFRALLIILFIDHIYLSFSQNIVMSRSGYILIIAIIITLSLKFYFQQIKREQ